VYAPTAFSPNGDGKNDVFYVYGPVDEIVQFQLNIYDRWGTLVFKTNDLQEGWDGTFDGNLAPTGAYVWVADFTTRPSAVVVEGETKQEKGNFILLQ
jgi:gliding motility-associated-like protein